MKVLFQPREQFERRTAQGYGLLPFRFMRWEDGTVLLTNEAGEHHFLDGVAFQQLFEQRLTPNLNVYKDLKAKQFLTDGDPGLAVTLLATKVRTKKSFLTGGVKLHLFVVTLRCDHSCGYCQVSRVTEDRARFDMTVETAAKAIELMFQSPARELKVEFQGGEALLNFALVQWCVERIERMNRIERRTIEFVIATNLAPLTDEILEFCRAHQVTLSTSLDGPADVHNANRPRAGGDSYEQVVRNLARARTILGPDKVSALMTTTAVTLRHPERIVDEYVKQGFESIFLRSISPYGFAVRGRQALLTGVQEFLGFYRAALAHIIEVNRAGRPLLEVFSQILLQKILTPFGTGYVDLQSPAGAATSVVAYNYDGDVYASDEGRMLAEMRDFSFRLGNVHRSSYGELLAGPVAQALVEASCMETLPGCCDCAFLPFCGADPIFNWATQGDPIGHRPSSAFCTKQMGVITHLFNLLKGSDEFTRRLLVSWATGVPVNSAP